MSFRIVAGDRLALLTVSNLAGKIVAKARAANDQPATYGRSFLGFPIPRPSTVPPWTDITLQTSALDATRAVQYTIADRQFPFNGTFEGLEVATSFSPATAGEYYRGQTFCEVLLLQGGDGQDTSTNSPGGTFRTTAARGYVFNGADLALGEFVEPGPGSGSGYVNTISVGDPAAGADYGSVAVPENAVWRVRGFTGTLVCAAVAASRFFRILFADKGGNAVARGVANVAATTGQTERYSASLEFNPSLVTADTGDIVFGLPEVILPEGYTVSFQTSNLNAADNWGPGFLTVEEWLVI